jgi:hypothetical protein
LKLKNINLSLLMTFMKVGLFTFGGGYAMISLIDSECVEKRKWITSDELMDVTAIGLYKKILKKNLSPILLIVFSACMGLMLYSI